MAFMERLNEDSAQAYPRKGVPIVHSPFGRWMITSGCWLTLVGLGVAVWQCIQWFRNGVWAFELPLALVGAGLVAVWIGVRAFAGARKRFGIAGDGA
jgi:hypothetical protein